VIIYQFPFSFFYCDGNVWSLAPLYDYLTEYDNHVLTDPYWSDNIARY
jgi:hypothetical protein